MTRGGLAAPGFRFYGMGFRGCAGKTGVCFSRQTGKPINGKGEYGRTCGRKQAKVGRSLLLVARLGEQAFQVFRRLLKLPGDLIEGYCDAPKQRQHDHDDDEIDQDNEKDCVAVHEVILLRHCPKARVVHLAYPGGV